MKTHVFYDSLQLEHDKPGHPETAQRLSAVSLRLEDWVNTKNIKLVSEGVEVTEEIIRLVHNDYHLRKFDIMNKYGIGHIDGDTYFTESTPEAAKVSLGGLLGLGKAVLEGDAENAFALIRPPGHHATPSTMMGFCIYSNVAILCKWLKTLEPDLKIAVFDFDVHHGNGTEDCLHKFEDMIFISTHQENIFPGTGLLKRKDNCFNLPLPVFTNDAEYNAVFEKSILPLLTGFSPDLLVVSAGYDAHMNDPLADLRLSSEFFGYLTNRLMELTEELNIRGPILSLEGGYNIPALVSSIEHTLDSLTGIKPSADFKNKLAQLEIKKETDQRIKEFSEVYSNPHNNIRLLK